MTRAQDAFRYFQHADDIWRDYPQLVAGVLVAEGIDVGAAVDGPIDRFYAQTRDRLAFATEGELPEIQAWRRTFSAMGLKPTQYRCASESLLRRFRKEGTLPRIHPLVDLCNAISMAFATPVAVLDTAMIVECLEVRYASGNEEYLAFSGAVEHPEPGEVTFADGAGRAHARRWTNRQSAYSAVRETTSSVLIVAEAVHESASEDVPKLAGVIADELGELWPVTPTAVVLNQASSRFTV